MAQTRIAAACLAALALAPVFAVCESSALAQNSRQPAPAPLDFDPTRPERVDGWWTNGTELMRLENSGAYQFWPTTDRFATPSEIGAWRRSNYVLFDLEPYRAKPGTRIPVELIKSAGATCIKREGMTPFKRTAVPPHVFGDDVLGVWTNEHEQLLVMENGRYEFRLPGAKTGITQHHGIWRTEGESLILAPDTDAVAPIRLDAQRVPDGSLVLLGTNGTLKQFKPEPAVPSVPAVPPASTPAASTPAASTPAAPATPPAQPTPPTTTSPASPTPPPATKPNH